MTSTSRPATSTPRPAPCVLVIGSASVDVSVSAAELPRPGETVIGTTSLIAVGGKGANQAVAAAACGAEARFIGRVGADAFGGMVQDGLRARGVDVSGLAAVADAPTGLATISVEDSGMNAIVVVPGANSRLLPADIDALRPLVEAAAVVVLQCEILPATLYRAIELAAESNTPVVLNPAPYRGLDLPRIAHAVTYLVPNETEAAQLWGQPVDTLEQAQACAVWLRAAGCGSVIITLGANGCFFADEHTLRHHPGHRVQAIDTTGAGDAFVGCLAAALAHGCSRDESIRRALLYSALSTTRRGAQVSYPDGGEFERAWSASPGLRSG